MYSMCVQLMDGQDSPANARKRPSFISCFVAAPPDPSPAQRGVHVAKIDPTSQRMHYYYQRESLKLPSRVPERRFYLQSAYKSLSEQHLFSRWIFNIVRPCRQVPTYLYRRYTFYVSPNSSARYTFGRYYDQT